MRTRAATLQTALQMQSQARLHWEQLLASCNTAVKTAFIRRAAYSAGKICGMQNKYPCLRRTETLHTHCLTETLGITRRLPARESKRAGVWMFPGVSLPKLFHCYCPHLWIMKECYFAPSALAGELKTAKTIPLLASESPPGPCM